MTAPDLSPGQAARVADQAPCRVVVDGDEDESYLVCLTCDPGTEVCCGHHRAPHDEQGCHEVIGSGAASIKCQCTRRAAAAIEVLRGEAR